MKLRRTKNNHAININKAVIIAAALVHFHSCFKYDIRRLDVSLQIYLRKLELIHS